MAQQNKTEIVIAAVDKATATLNQIGARMDALTKPAADLSKAFGKLYDATGLGAVKKAVGGLKDSILGLGSAMIGIGGVYSGTVGSLIMAGNHAVDVADKIGDLSARYQIHANTLQVYGAMVEEAGGSTEDAAAAMGKLNKAINEAIHGGKEQAAAFAGVGISIEKLKKMSPEQVMEQMADAFKGSEQDMAKQAVLLELMGKNGTVFMDVMNKGSAEYRKRLEEMRADGALLSEEQLQQADDYDKTWKRLQRTLDGIKTALGLKLAHALETTVQGIQQWTVANRALIDQKFDAFLAKLPDILAIGRDMMIGLWGVVEKVGGAFKILNGLLGPTGGTLLLVAGIMSPLIMAAGQLAFTIGKAAWILGNFTGVIPLAVKALSGLWSVMLANPFGVLAAAVVGLGVLVYTNWDNIVQYVSGAWERIKSVFDVGFFDGLIQVWLESWQALANSIIGMIKSLTPEFLMPEAFKNFQFSFATDRAKSVTTAAAAAQAQRQDITNTVRLVIDADGRPRVKELAAGSQNTTIDVSAGLAMAGV